MADKTLTLTIVIPVYNEEGYLKACLDSIAAQSLMPEEVIVVDNNSTDDSLKVAKQYSFVKVLHEARQHQVFAQAAGFNAARGDILGRIDADTILPEDWVERVKRAFDDKKIIAVTGGCEPYDAPLKWLGVAIFHGYIYAAGLIAGTRLLWGSNCAVRASGWRKVKHQVLMRPDIWEDYDLAFCLRGTGRIKYLAKIPAGVSFRAMHTSFSKHLSYQFRSVRTFYYRVNFLRLGLFIFLWSLTIVVYPLAALDDRLLKKNS